MRFAIALALLAAASTPVPVRATDGQGQQASQPSTGSCAKGDPSRDRIANATGGQAVRFRPGEMATHGGAYMAGQFNHPVAVHVATGRLPAAASRRIDFQVDKAIDSLWIVASIECNDSIEIVDPDGAAVPAQGSSSGITQLLAANVRTITSPRPKPGRWSVTVNGSGIYAVSVRAKTRLTLETFEFVQPAGGPGKKGYVRIAGPPASRKQTAHAVVSGPPVEASFAFLDEQGTVLQAFTLQRNGSGPDRQGPVELPAGPFRVAWIGTDEQGQAFQRIDPRLRVVGSALP